VTLLEDINTNDLLAMLVVPGARLAMDILDDNIAAQAPRYRHLFAKHALELLNFGPDDATYRLADSLRGVCEAHPPTRRMVENAIERALTTNEPASVAAVTVLARWEQGTGALAASARQRLHRLLRTLNQDQQRALVPLGRVCNVDGTTR
jgi:hypothetical protein